MHNAYIPSHLKFYHKLRFFGFHIQIKSVAMESINSPFENMKIEALFTSGQKVI